MVTGLRMMSPSEMSLRIVWRELALEISLTSLGSSQILRSPHLATEAARRFWVRRLTLRRSGGLALIGVLPLRGAEARKIGLEFVLVILDRWKDGVV